MFRMGAIALPLSSLFGPDALRFRLRHGEREGGDHFGGQCADGSARRWAAADGVRCW